MNDKFFLVQVKHTNGTWEKGVVIKDTLDSARQSYHAYLGAYGYGNNPQADYVACFILSDEGTNCDMTIDDRRAASEE